MRDCESCKNHTDKGCTKWKCEFEPITKNDLGVASELEKNSKKLEKDFGELDCVSRDSAIKALGYDIKSFEFKPGVSKHMVDIVKLLNTIYETQVNNIKALPSVTPQEPQTFKWCTDCKEYDQEKHCCHRWSKVIRDTVEEMKQEQEPFKPMVEIDLYSVIKQKYIEREVLDKIREQIKDYLRGVEITLEVLVENDPLRPKMEGAKDTLEECLNLIDKAESEDKE